MDSVVPGENIEYSPTNASQNRVYRLRGYHAHTYTSHNATEADRAWNEINDGAGIVAVDKAWAKDRNLPPTREYTADRSKLVYSLAAYHSMHCLPLLRSYIKGLVHDPSQTEEWEFEHALHCLDTLRQEIMCTASDALLDVPVTEDWQALPIGLKTVRHCNNWGVISSWAAQHSACYRVHPNDDRAFDLAECRREDGVIID